MLVGAAGALTVSQLFYRDRRAIACDAGIKPTYEQDVKANTKPDDLRWSEGNAYEEAIAELKKVFDEDSISTSKQELTDHAVGRAGSYHKATRQPAVVVYPTSTEQVSKAIAIAQTYSMPVTPYAGGTALEGHTISSYGGLCLDLARMDQILNINVDDADMTVQPGISWEAINAELEDREIPLFFPLDPGPGATVGGMIATGCSGTNAMRYGTARAEWFLNVTVVLPNGKVIKTRSRARKSAAGFDLTKLFIGAEGTLGVVTEATLRLAPLLPYRVAVCGFPDAASAVTAVTKVINSGAPVQCAELCDNIAMRAINEHGGCNRKLPESDTIFFKFQGDPAVMDNTAEKVSGIVRQYGGKDLQFANDKDESDDLWAARKSLRFSLMALKPGSSTYSTDICVPISELSAIIRDTKKDLKESGIFAAALGHVGDGNVHFSMLVEKDEDLEKIDAAGHRLVERAIAHGGTCTGEHSVGVGKKQYLESELGKGTVELMESIKQLIDPNGIMNPGKLYPNLPKEGAKGGH